MRIQRFSVTLASSSIAAMAWGYKIEVVTQSSDLVKLGRCQGDCDADNHCEDGLRCFQREKNDPVPGCEGGEADNSRTDYCVPVNQSPSSSHMSEAAPVAAIFDKKLPALISYGSRPPAYLLPLKRCQGDCDCDDHCMKGLYCFQRNSNDPVPGCAGGEIDNSRTDYCVSKASFISLPSSPQAPQSLPPTPSPSITTSAPSVNAFPSVVAPVTRTGMNPLPALVSFGSNPPFFRLPLQLCQGDCDNDDHCAQGLYCYQRGSNDPVPGCTGGTIDNSRTDYCVSKSGLPAPQAFPSSAPTEYPTIATQSPTWHLSTTTPSLGQTAVVSTMSPTRDLSTATPSLGETAVVTDPPSLSPTQEPTNPLSGSPVKDMTDSTLPWLVSYGGDPPASALPLQLCEGDCDADDMCEPGLICFQRNSNVTVPGCIGGLEDVSQQDYCINPASPAVDTYIPGKLTVQKLGLLLSEGLDAKIIATTGERVQYHDGRESQEVFHLNPDAGATFPDTREGNEGGWIYVSNSEVNDAQGGVGAITFDKDGNILDYKMLLKRSSMNCGGGRTPFGTWVSCEEVDARGQIYQVDPTGVKAPQVLTLGKDGGRFESFAYDVRDRMHPRFFVTEDHERGALRRFTPFNPDWDEPWDMLHGQGKEDYLLLHPSDSEDFGIFEWTDNLAKAKSNAQQYYQNTEGIDVNGSQLFFVCKVSKHIFTLDLDRMIYSRKSTVNGLFDGSPDQIERVLEGSSEFLYFTEEGGSDAGVHARNADGHFFAIFESPVYEDETTGLSWSPDGRIMYVAYQFTGFLFSIWRQDGAPFHQTQLDVKFHHQP